MAWTTPTARTTGELITALVTTLEASDVALAQVHVDRHWNKFSTAIVAVTCWSV